jgi:hypothetical protein
MRLGNPESSNQPMRWDVFISHAHEDKEAVVRPLAHLLASYGLEVWYDEFSLRLGDPLRVSLDKGLSNARFGVVVLSRAFFEKKWTSFELDALIQRESPGEKLVLPLWFGIEAGDLRTLSPSLADKVALTVDGTEESLKRAAIQILQEVRPDLYGHLARRRALLKDLASSPLEGLKTTDLEELIVPEGPVFQEELGAELLSRIRLVRACLASVHSADMMEWIHDFRREPFPYNEIMIWEYIASVYSEVTEAFSLKPHHRRMVYALVLESATFADDLKERHAPLWKALPDRVRAMLEERMSIKAPFEIWKKGAFQGGGDKS